MHLADAFIQSNLQYIQVIHFLSVCVFPGNWTHNLCAANVLFILQLYIYLEFQSRHINNNIYVCMCDPLCEI